MPAILIGTLAPKVTPAPKLALDRGFAERIKTARSEHIKARKAERGYAQKLRRIARHIGDFVNSIYDEADPLGSAGHISVLLGQYAQALEPWARAVGREMVTEVASRDKKAWRDTSAEISRLLRDEIESTPTGRLYQARVADQVRLITSLPLDAAERVQKLARETMLQGGRGDALVREIMRSGAVSRSRAELIATTEVSRTHTEFQRARSEWAGVTHYKWLTMGDGNVRHDHKILNGKVFAWADPPIADSRNGERAHPGCIYRCRCVAIPVID